MGLDLLLLDFWPTWIEDEVARSVLPQFLMLRLKWVGRREGLVVVVDVVDVVEARAGLAVVVVGAGLLLGLVAGRGLLLRVQVVVEVVIGVEVAAARRLSKILQPHFVALKYFGNGTLTTLCI